MTSKKDSKKDRKARRAASRRAYKVAAKAIPLPPAEREEASLADLQAQLRAADNVRDIPLGMLRIHPVHGDRNPYKDTPDGLKRRHRCEAHIRESGGWNDLACEVLTVCDGGDGFFDVINGVGRMYMADVLSGGTVKTLSCRVLKKLSTAQVEKVFEIMGTQLTKVSPYDVWRSKVAHRGAAGDEVRAIVAVLDRVGKTIWRKPPLAVLRFGQATLSAKDGKPVLERALLLVANTSLGADKRYAAIFTAAVIAMLGSNPRFDEARFRHVVGEGDLVNDALGGWLFDRAQKKANAMGYLKPHTRTVAWIAAQIIAEELYNKALAPAKHLDIDALATKVNTDYLDAYSSAAPKAKRARFTVVKTEGQAVA